jgi:hypothetical protein
MSAKDLVIEVCTRRLRGLTKLSRDEMRLAGYPDSTPEMSARASSEVTSAATPLTFVPIFVTMPLRIKSRSRQGHQPPDSG